MKIIWKKELFKLKYKKKSKIKNKNTTNIINLWKSGETILKTNILILPTKGT